LTDVIPDEGDTYTWKSEDVSTMLDTWTKITDAEMYVVYQKVGGPPSVETIYIRRAYLYVDYTPSADTTPPTYTNDGDNSTGPVTEGAIVETHVYWTDAGSNLGKAVLRTNKTGEWTNESWHTFTTDPEWANITFDTTGHVGKTICWVQWANDTSDNWNTSMSTTAHCFNVLHVTKISQVLINDTNPDQGESVKIDAKLEYGNGTAIADQNVSFYYNSSFINSDFTNSTGWATVLWDTIGVNNGTYNINATYSGNSSIYTGASYNNTREVEVVGIAEKIWVTNIETHFVRVTKTTGGVPNVVLTVHNTIFGSMLAGDNTTIYISLTLNNSEGTGPAEIKAVFTTNDGVVYGLNGTFGSNIIPGNYFELGLGGSEKALSNTTTKTFISIVGAGATVDYNAILTVPAGQTADDYNGTVELSW
ncbi:MAG: hypothetical protein KAT65_14020, partial [Methanophagales archaeon]|nr:hypothetical protein [Methanophagales archaeon]